MEFCSCFRDLVNAHYGSIGRWAALAPLAAANQNATRSNIRESLYKFLPLLVRIGNVNEDEQVSGGSPSKSK